jgi:glycosidase
MVTAAQSGDGSSVQRALTRITTLYPSSSGYGAFLTNHDQDRIASQLKGDDAELKLAADLLLLGPGVPFVHYGEEIGMTGAKPDERIRTPMRWNDSTPAAGFSTGTPWEPLSDDPPSVNVAAEAASATSLWSRYRDLIRLRTEHPALATGVWTPITTDAPTVVAALRVAPSEVVVTLTNAGASAVSPTLTMAGGSLCGSPRADALLGASSVAAPVVSATGGVAGWQPVPSIPARSSVVIALASGGG